MGYALMVVIGLFCVLVLVLCLVVKRLKYWKASCKEAETTIQSLKEDIKLKEHFDVIRKENEENKKDTDYRLADHDDSVLSELRNKSKNREKVTNQ